MIALSPSVVESWLFACLSSIIEFNPTLVPSLHCPSTHRDECYLCIDNNTLHARQHVDPPASPTNLSLSCLAYPDQVQSSIPGVPQVYGICKIWNTATKTTLKLCLSYNMQLRLRPQISPGTGRYWYSVLIGEFNGGYADLPTGAYKEREIIS